MKAQVWTKMAMASALMMWGMTTQAQITSGGVSAGQGVAANQTRPAPVSGKVGSDPAAVALRPAAQAPVTSKATQVAPPANPNEPLFLPAAETPARAATVSHAASPKTAEPLGQQRKPHVDRTEGVKKPGKTAPQAHDKKKAHGKPRHARKGAASNTDASQHDGAGKDAHKGKKKADKSAALHQPGNRRQVTPSAQKGGGVQQARSPSTKKRSERTAAGKHAESPKAQAKASSSQRVARTSTAVAASTGKGARRHTASAAHQAAHMATPKSARKKAAGHAAAKSTVAGKAHKNANKAARSSHKPA